MPRYLDQRIALMFFTCILATACGNQSKKPSTAGESSAPVAVPTPSQTLPAKEANGVKYPGAQSLTSVGSNSQGAFSKDGKKVIYVSENRSAHRSQQIYELDLLTRRERRLTFQDGYLQSPHYTQRTDEFIYASSTDEMKERLDLSRVLSGDRNVSTDGANARKSEIYLRQINTSKVERLTHNPGFDGDPYPHPSKKLAVFISERSNGLRLAQLNIANMQVETLAQASVIESPAYSAQGDQLTWVQGDSPEDQHVVTASANGKNLKPLTTKAALDRHPRWSPDSAWIIFSSNRDDSTRSSLYIANTKGSCIKRITDHSGDDIEPSFSPDGQKVLFTHREGGKSQIFLMDFKPPEACLSQQG